MKGIIRKTILGIWFFGGLSACTSKPHFTIEGSLDEKVDGEAYIVGYPGWNKKPDTLARAEIRDGKFTLTGSLPDTMEAGLYITGEKTYAILLLENADYRAHLHLKNPEANRVEGPELQLLFAAYQAIGNKTAGQTNELRNRYYSARQKNDTATMNEVMRTMGKLGEQTGREQEQFREAHKDGFLAAYLLNKRMYQYQNIEDLQREYDQLGASAKAMKLTRQVVERLDEMAAFAPGKKAPDFTLPTPEGDSLSMYSIQGKVKILDFWASWCAPCRAENPYMVELYKKYHRHGLEILSVSLDHQQAPWVKAIADDHLSWNHVMDTQDVSRGMYKLLCGILHVIVLDENNVIVANGIRGKQLDIKLKAIFGK